MTYTVVDLENMITMKYKLHFWVFRVGQHALRASEISLFENADFSDYLNVHICQWPNQFDRVVIFGER